MSKNEERFVQYSKLVLGVIALAGLAYHIL